MEAQSEYRSNQQDDRMEDNHLDFLKWEIKRVQARLDKLQKIYRNQVGRDYRPAPR